MPQHSMKNAFLLALQLALAICICEAASQVGPGESVSNQQALFASGSVSVHVSGAQLHVLSATFNYATNLKTACEESLKGYQAGRHPAMPSCLSVDILKSSDTAHAAIRGLASSRAVAGFDESIDQVLDPLEVDFFKEVVKLSKEHSAFTLLASHVVAEERSLLESVKRVAQLMTYTADRARSTDKHSWVDALFVARSLVGQVARAVHTLDDFEPPGIRLIQEALVNASIFVPMERQNEVRAAIASCQESGRKYAGTFEHLRAILGKRMQQHEALFEALHAIYKDIAAGTLEPFETADIPDAFWNRATGFKTIDVHSAPDILERINYEVQQVLRPRNRNQSALEHIMVDPAVHE